MPHTILIFSVLIGICLISEFTVHALLNSICCGRPMVNCHHNLLFLKQRNEGMNYGGNIGLRRESVLLLSALRKDSTASNTPKQKKVKEDIIQVNGKVIEALPNAMFRVEIEPSKQVILATISGKIRKNIVRIVVGDSVQLELSAYDLSRGRITYRNKS